jgi:Cu-Zn family superoxide dismutase
MRQTLKTVGGLCAIGAAVAGMQAGAGATGADTVRSADPLVVYSAIVDNPLAGVTGTAHAVQTPNGKTIVTLQLHGFDPTFAGRTFGAHVHTGPCADNVSAGSHFTSTEPDVPLELREVWLDFTVNASGQGSATASRDFAIPDGAAQAVVIHQNPTDPAGVAGPRLGCLDLEL